MAAVSIIDGCSLSSDSVVHLLCTPALTSAGVHIECSVSTHQHILQKSRNSEVRELLKACRAQDREDLLRRKHELARQLDGKDPAKLRGDSRDQFDGDCLDLTLLMHVLDPATTPLLLVRPPQPDGCTVCGTGEDLMKCGKCRMTPYCSKKCQKAHWETHKKDCRFESAGKSRFLNLSS